MAQGLSSSRATTSAGGASKSKGKMSMRVGHQATTSTSTTGRPAKSQKKTTAAAAAAASDDEDEQSDAAGAYNNDDDDLELEDDAGTPSDYDDGEPDTEDEIEAAKTTAGGKSKKTAKRKRRATSPTSFGLALQDLLGVAPESSDEGALDDDRDHGDDARAAAAATTADEDEATAPRKPAKRQKAAPLQSAPSSSTILSLAPHLRRSAQSVQLNARASRIAIEERRAREERARVKDVIGGWGPPGVLPTLQLPGSEAVKKDDGDEDQLGEWALQGGSTDYERRLRKVAQRGVVKLFNAIRAAQTTTKEDLEDVDTQPAKSAPKGLGAVGSSKKANALGGKEARLADLSKTNFLDLIRKGTGSAGTKSGVAAK